MKLSSLTPEQKTLLLAELDEWCEPMSYPGSLPPYLTSYDAIIPLVQKLDGQYGQAILDEIHRCVTSSLHATPSQICDAVLVATGKAEL